MNSYKHHTSEQVSLNLISKAKEGDEYGQQELYNRTYNYVYMIISLLVKDENISDELVEDTYNKAYSEIKELQDLTLFKSWIGHIAHHLAIEYLHQTNHDIFIKINEDDVDFVDDFKDEPDVSLSKDETIRILKGVFDNLSDGQRIVLVMFYYENYTIKDISLELGISENIVRLYLTDGLNQVEKNMIPLDLKNDEKLCEINPVSLLCLLFRNVEALELYEPKTNLVLKKSHMISKGIKLFWIINLIISFILFFNSKYETPPINNPVVEGELVSCQEVYRPLLEEYQHFLENLNPKIKYQYLNSYFMNNYLDKKENFSEGLIYAYYDIDHNKQEELLIGYYDMNCPRVIAIYGRNSNTIEPIFVDCGLDVNHRIIISTDGKVMSVSRSENAYDYMIHRIEKNKLKFIDSKTSSVLDEMMHFEWHEIEKDK